MAEWIVENWFIIVALAAVAGGVACAIYKFAGLPTKEQIAKIKQWLLLVVTQAEKELGGGTGQLKLRYVYDLFISRFPTTAKIVSFETFSKWVDDALDDMRKMLESNKAAQEFVAGNTQEESEGNR